MDILLFKIYSYCLLIYLLMFFVQSLVMRRMPEQKACFLSESTESAPKPQDLKNALDKVTFLSSFASNDWCSNFTVKFMIKPPFFDVFCFFFTVKCQFYTWYEFRTRSFWLLSN